MDKGYGRIPRPLCDWITFLSSALPPRSVRTFLELLIGAMLTPAGFVTEAYLLLGMRNHWTSYYKWLQAGRWSWLGLARQFVRLVWDVASPEVVYLAIDDTLTLRASKKAPGSQIHHQHGNKPNLARYVRGQCWVSLAWVLRKGTRSVAVPLLLRLVPGSGNSGKLVAARVLIRAVCGWLGEMPVRVLVDSWYMRRSFIEAMLSRGFHVIGQVHIDTRLYAEPPQRRPGQPGRPRKYGEKYTPERVAQLERTETTLHLHGREQAMRYRSRVVLARFLGGLPVRVVWCEYADGKGQWKKPRLLLSTDTSLSPEQVIEDYGRRWSIESMFHQLKQAWGLKEAWQQSRQTLHRWVQLIQVGYGLIQLLGYLDDAAVRQLCQHSPWRKDHPVTAGRLRKGLLQVFQQVPVRLWWNRKSKKFEPPDWRGGQPDEQNAEISLP